MFLQDQQKIRMLCNYISVNSKFEVLESLQIPRNYQSQNCVVYILNISRNHPEMDLNVAVDEVLDMCSTAVLWTRKFTSMCPRCSHIIFILGCCEHRPDMQCFAVKLPSMGFWQGRPISVVLNLLRFEAPLGRCQLSTFWVLLVVKRWVKDQDRS